MFQVDGKILCWLCSLAYKRVLAKAKQREEQKLEAKKGVSSNRQSYDKLEKLDKSDKQPDWIPVEKSDRLEKVEKLEKMETNSAGSNSRHSFVDKISPLGESNSQSARSLQKDKTVNLSTEEKSTPPSFASSLAFLRDHKDEKSNDSADVKMAEDENQEAHKSRHHHHHHHHKHKHHKRYVFLIVRIRKIYPNPFISYLSY